MWKASGHGFSVPLAVVARMGVRREKEVNRGSRREGMRVKAYIVAGVEWWVS
jgi:hypothetical protein